MDEGVSPGTAKNLGKALSASSAPRGLAVITHPPRGHGGSSLMNPVSVTSQLFSLFQMLDVTVSQLLNLQPSLAARVTSKHRDVKESWAQLQQALR